MTNSFWVPGEPQPRQGDRSRIAKKKTGEQYIHHYQEETGPKAEWVATVRSFALKYRRGELWDAPVAMSLIFVRLKPKSWPKRKQWPYKAPDLDNLEKPALDALNGVQLYDDSRVVIKHTYKIYGPYPGVLITIMPMEHDADLELTASQLKIETFEAFYRLKEDWDAT